MAMIVAAKTGFKSGVKLKHALSPGVLGALRSFGFSTLAASIPHAPKLTLTNASKHTQLTRHASRAYGTARGDTTRVLASHCMRPAPEKRDRGEDAFFIDIDADGSLVTGVADGVGGWSLEGIDAGMYARELMDNAQQVSKHKNFRSSPKSVLAHAHSRMSPETKGSCTACIVVFAGDELRYANLGDSGLFGWRMGATEPFIRTTEQQHRWNCPFQLGHEAGDRPQSAHEGRVKIQRGDIIILATDGFFDNVFNAKIMQLITTWMQQYDSRQAFMNGWPRGDAPPIPSAVASDLPAAASSASSSSSSSSSTSAPSVADIAASILPNAAPPSHGAHAGLAPASSSQSRPVTPMPRSPHHASTSGLHTQAAAELDATAASAASSSSAAPSSSQSSSDASPIQILDNEGLSLLAKFLVAEASKAAAGRAETPFSQNAQRQGKKYRGGKPDDITVVVAQVIRSDPIADSQPRVA